MGAEERLFIGRSDLDVGLAYGLAGGFGGSGETLLCLETFASNGRGSGDGGDRRRVERGSGAEGSSGYIGAYGLNGLFGKGRVAHKVEESGLKGGGVEEHLVNGGVFRTSRSM